MIHAQEPTVENEICKRCERRTRVLSNGLCSRCDDVLYGHKSQPCEIENRLWYPKQTPPIKPSEYPPYLKREQYWCLTEMI